MAKRCCAKHCFNSVLYNKQISYFSFPKHKVFADQWAELAGRSDLKDKPLKCVVKYYLCSEHFTANCFVDAERQILRRNLPNSIAIPTIFKNNLQETMQIANPRQSIEVHNIVVLEDRILKHNPLFEISNETSAENSLSETSSIIEKPVDEFLSKDEVEPYLDICMQSPSYEEVERKLFTIQLPDITKQCRFCLRALTYDEETVHIEDSLQLKEFIARVMSSTISVGDKLSQFACKNCENNALLCLIIIQQMDASQEKLVAKEGNT